MVASLSLHWSVPTCFVKEHRSSANQPVRFYSFGNFRRRLARELLVNEHIDGTLQCHCCPSGGLLTAAVGHFRTVCDYTSGSIQFCWARLRTEAKNYSPRDVAKFLSGIGSATRNKAQTKPQMLQPRKDTARRSFRTSRQCCGVR